VCFLFTPPAPPAAYTLSLHDALPISGAEGVVDVRHRHHARLDRDIGGGQLARIAAAVELLVMRVGDDRDAVQVLRPGDLAQKVRSEEHTSELQSRFDLVCRLLLEKKK